MPFLRRFVCDFVLDFLRQFYLKPAFSSLSFFAFFFFPSSFLVIFWCLLLQRMMRPGGPHHEIREKSHLPVLRGSFRS